LIFENDNNTILSLSLARHLLTLRPGKSVV